MQANKTLRTCKEGHKYFKSSNCPICPICENAQKKGGFLSLISAPARRALEKNLIFTLTALSKYSKEEILNFHGLGKATLPILEKALAENDLSFKSDE